MRKYTKENLMKLSKEQLISIIDNWQSTDFKISCVLVDESKWNIDSKEAVEKIREYCLNKKYNSLDNEHLGDLINCDNGIITVDEYRKKVGLE